MKANLANREWSGRATVLVIFQCRGVPRIWIIVGQRSTVSAVGMDADLWLFSLVFNFPSPWETVRYLNWNTDSKSRKPQAAGQKKKKTPRKTNHECFYSQITFAKFSATGTYRRILPQTSGEIRQVLLAREQRRPPTKPSQPHALRNTCKGSKKGRWDADRTCNKPNIKPKNGSQRLLSWLRKCLGHGGLSLVGAVGGVGCWTSLAPAFRRCIYCLALSLFLVGTVELQCLEKFQNHKNMFEAGVVWANECKS